MKSLGKLYRQEWHIFVNRRRPLLYWIVGLVVIVTIGLYVYLSKHPRGVQLVFSALTVSLNRSGALSSHSSVDVLQIFWQNFRVSLMALTLGLIPLFVLSSLWSVTTASSIVITILYLRSHSYLLTAHGLTLGAVLWRGILLHAPVELLAFSYTGVLGFELSQAMSSFIGRRDTHLLAERVMSVYRSYVLIVLPLLFLAALVEGLVVPVLLTV